MPSSLVTWLAYGGVGVTLTALISLISVLVTSRIETRKLDQVLEDNASKNLREARVVSVETAEAAVGIVRSVMETQQLQLLDLNQRVTDQGTQLVAISAQNQVAIAHIADREAWTAQHWPRRPPSLPTIPELIREDVLQMKTFLHSARREHRDPTSSDEEDV